MPPVRRVASLGLAVAGGAAIGATVAKNKAKSEQQASNSTQGGSSGMSGMSGMSGLRIYETTVISNKLFVHVVLPDGTTVFYPVLIDEQGKRFFTFNSSNVYFWTIDRSTNWQIEQLKKNKKFSPFKCIR